MNERGADWAAWADDADPKGPITTERHAEPPSPVPAQPQPISDIEGRVATLRAALRGGGDRATFDLAQTLLDLAVRQLAEHRNDDALSSAREAGALLRRLRRRYRDAVVPLVAARTAELDALARFSSRRGEATRVAAAMVRVVRKAARRDPGTYLPLLAQALHRLAGVILAAGYPGAAVRAAREAHQVTARLTARDGETHAALMVQVLSMLALASRAAGGRDALDAQDHALSAVAAARMLTVTAKEDQRALLAGTLRDASGILRDAGRLDAASRSASELVEIARVLLAESEPQAERLLLDGLGLSSDILRRLGNTDEAIAVERELVTRLGILLATAAESWAEESLRATQQLLADLVTVGTDSDQARAELNSMIDPGLVALAERRVEAQHPL